MTENHDDKNNDHGRGLGDILDKLLLKMGTATGNISLGQISGLSGRIERALIDAMTQALHDNFTSEFPPHIVISVLSRNLAIAAGHSCKTGHNEAMLDLITDKIRNEFNIVYDATQREAAEDEAPRDPDEAAEREVVKEGGYD